MATISSLVCGNLCALSRQIAGETETRAICYAILARGVGMRTVLGGLNPPKRPLQIISNPH